MVLLLGNSERTLSKHLHAKLFLPTPHRKCNAVPVKTAIKARELTFDL